MDLEEKWSQLLHFRRPNGETKRWAILTVDFHFARAGIRYTAKGQVLMALRSSSRPSRDCSACGWMLNPLHFLVCPLEDPPFHCMRAEGESGRGVEIVIFHMGRVCTGRLSYGSKRPQFMR